jgi:hypothetical protein
METSQGSDPAGGSLYGFIKYDLPKFGVFNIDTNEYKLPGGWIQKETEFKIIGETEDTFVTRLQEGGHGEWVGDVVIEEKYVLPIGIHKTRFVRWIPGQLSIFD